MQLKSASTRLKNAVRDIPDFPLPGITFRDISPILEDGQLFRLATTLFADRYQRKSIDAVVAIDARGFIFGSALAYVLGTGLILARKKGKLPYKTVESSYDLEYGKNTLEMHHDGVKPGQRIVIIDDVLATGGTMRATCDMVRRLGGDIIEVAFLIEICGLEGAAKLAPSPTFSIIQY